MSKRYQVYFILILQNVGSYAQNLQTKSFNHHQFDDLEEYPNLFSN